jgi:hypothetical protein
MQFNFVSLVAALAAVSTAKWTNDSPEPIQPAPAPWTLQGTVYSLFFVPLSDKLPVKAYSPLERAHLSQHDGQFEGKLGTIQIIRYYDSPVGPYDELLITPGFFKYNNTDPYSGTVTERENVRITRIYVSQKYTCWNGRNNWNIPKHLARFDWTDSWDGSTTVKVYPHDTEGDAKESKAAQKPWFKATFKRDLLGGLPFSTSLFELLGVNATLAQPPLPSKDSKYGELVGTNRWAATVPEQTTNHAYLGFYDMRQGEGDITLDKKTNAVGDEYFPNFWPGLLPFHPGLKLDNATIVFNSPEIWKNSD